MGKRDSIGGSTSQAQSPMGNTIFSQQDGIQGHFAQKRMTQPFEDTKSLINQT